MGQYGLQQHQQFSKKCLQFKWYHKGFSWAESYTRAHREWKNFEKKAEADRRRRSMPPPEPERPPRTRLTSRPRHGSNSPGRSPTSPAAKAKSPSRTKSPPLRAKPAKAKPAKAKSQSPLKKRKLSRSPPRAKPAKAKSQSPRRLASKAATSKPKDKNVRARSTDQGKSTTKEDKPGTRRRVEVDKASAVKAKDKKNALAEKPPSDSSSSGQEEEYSYYTEEDEVPKAGAKAKAKAKAVAVAVKAAAAPAPAGQPAITASGSRGMGVTAIADFFESQATFLRRVG